MSEAIPRDIQINAPADVERRPDPVFIEGTAYMVPSFYDARWHNRNLTKPVTIGGEPLIANGEVQTVGGVPPWRRYALQPDSGEVVSQEDFARMKRLADIEYVYEKSGHRNTLGFPEQEPIPNVREFVAWKRHPNEPEKLIPLGVSHERQRIRRGNHFYDPISQQLVSWDSLPTDKQAKVIAALIDKGGETEAPPAPVRAVEPEEQKVVKKYMLEPSAAPCGQEAKSKAGAMAHSRKCPKCQEIMTGAAEVSQL
jgi:hypothetical protein